MKKLSSLPHLPAFEAAARKMSFSAAADELFITTGAISRHIRSLEDQLGIQLFYRAHKSVRLTQQGEILSKVATKILNELAEAEHLLYKKKPSGKLIIQCLPTFAMHWLIPKLPALSEAFPGLKIDVVTSTGPVNFDIPFDVAIRRDPKHFSGLKGIPFLKESSKLVCSKSYLERMPKLSAENLSNHEKIVIRAREDLWSSWYAQFPDVGNHVSVPSITLDHTFAAIQAAEDGMGIAVIPHFFCANHLQSGRLISPLEDTEIDTGMYYLLLRDRKDDTVMGFVDWFNPSNF